MSTCCLFRRTLLVMSWAGQTQRWQTARNSLQWCRLRFNWRKILAWHWRNRYCSILHLHVIVLQISLTSNKSYPVFVNANKEALVLLQRKSFVVNISFIDASWKKRNSPVKKRRKTCLQWRSIAKWRLHRWLEWWVTTRKSMTVCLWLKIMKFSS